MKCLDSSFLADYSRGRTAAIRYLEAHTDSNFLVPTIALYELFAGRLKTGGSVTLGDLDASLDWATKIDFTDEHALEAARVRQELMNRGSRIQHPDMLVAGIARSLGAPIVASDEDFERVDGLPVENHWRLYSE